MIKADLLSPVWIKSGGWSETLVMLCWLAGMTSSIFHRPSSMPFLAENAKSCFFCDIIRANKIRRRKWHSAPIVEPTWEIMTNSASHAALRLYLFRLNRTSQRHKRTSPRRPHQPINRLRFINLHLPINPLLCISHLRHIRRRHTHPVMLIHRNRLEFRANRSLELFLMPAAKKVSYLWKASILSLPTREWFLPR